MTAVRKYKDTLRWLWLDLTYLPEYLSDCCIKNGLDSRKQKQEKSTVKTVIVGFEI